ISWEVARGEKQLPTPLEIHPSRWPLQPDRIAIGDAKRGEQRGERIAHQRSIEVRESPRSYDYQYGEYGRRDRTRQRRPKHLSIHRCLDLACHRIPCAA